MMSLYKPPLERLQRQLDKKYSRLAELEEKCENATNPVSRASFKGKITRCQKDIGSLEAKIERLYG